MLSSKEYLADTVASSCSAEDLKQSCGVHTSTPVTPVPHPVSVQCGVSLPTRQNLEQVEPLGNTPRDHPSPRHCTGWGWGEVAAVS